jgi:hypothetical protein
MRIQNNPWREHMPMQARTHTSLHICARRRNGSNPYFDPYGSYHWFEGSGVSIVITLLWVLAGKKAHEKAHENHMWQTGLGLRGKKHETLIA